MTSKASILNIYFPGFDINTDPQTMVDARSMQVNLQIHRGLFRFLPNGEVMPDLATQWKFSSNHKILKVKLKKSTFSDGTSIKAKHVVNTFARMFVIGSSMSADLSGIKGSKKIQSEHDTKNFGVKATGDLTLEFHLEKPNAILLQQLATVDCAVLPIFDIISQVFKSNSWLPMTGAGPYRILKKTTTQITLQKWRNDDFETLNSPDQIQIFLTKEMDAQKLIESLKVDSLDQAVVSESIKIKLKSDGWNEYVTDLTREHFLIFNPERLSFSLRQQLIATLDPEAISIELGSEFSPAFGLIPPVLGGHLNKSKIKHENKNSKAENFRPVEILLPDTWEHGERLKIALAKTWSKLNFNLKFKMVSPKEWNKNKLEKNYDILVNSKGVDYPDGLSILNYFRSGVEGNYYFISDRKIDKLLDSASQEFISEKRFEIYRMIQNAILAKEIVAPILFGSQASGLWGPRVKSVPAHPLGYHFLPFEMIEMR